MPVICTNNTKPQISLLCSIILYEYPLFTSLKFYLHIVHLLSQNKQRKKQTNNIPIYFGKWKSSLQKKQYLLAWSLFTFQLWNNV